MSGPNLQRQKLTIRAYRGTCLLCRHDLFEGDDIVRGRGQLLGALHAGCARKAAESHAGATNGAGAGTDKGENRSEPHDAAEGRP